LQSDTYKGKCIQFDENKTHTHIIYTNRRQNKNTQYTHTNTQLTYGATSAYCKKSYIWHTAYVQILTYSHTV